MVVLGLDFCSKKSMKNYQKIIEKLSRFWKPLLEASWELLGLSWGALGPLLGTLGDPKWCPREVVTLIQGSFFCNLNFYHLFFLNFAASWCLWGLSWEHFGPSGISPGRIFDSLGAHFSTIIKKMIGFLDSLPLFMFTYCGSAIIWYPMNSLTHFAPLTP